MGEAVAKPLPIRRGGHGAHDRREVTVGSKSREVRRGQLDRAEATLKAYVGRLTAEGADEAKIDRHPTVRQLRASAKEARGRIAAIDAKEALNASLAEWKAKRLEEKKAGAKKKGKKDDKGKGKAKAKGKDKGAAQGSQPGKQKKDKDKDKDKKGDKKKK
jgi:hypothetical protein